MDNHLGLSVLAVLGRLGHICTRFMAGISRMGKMFRYAVVCCVWDFWLPFFVGGIVMNGPPSGPGRTKRCGVEP